MKRHKKKLLFIFVLLFFAGCAAYKLEPLMTTHPAHPEATAVPVHPVSKTLAYTRADMPSAQPVSTVAAGQQEERGARPAQAAAKETVVGEGKVIATVPSANQVVVEHGEIKGFMDAMTMGYKVNQPSLLEGLKSGDKVRFTIDVQKNAIVKIEKMK